jgi:aldose 1-epimerase
MLMERLLVFTAAACMLTAVSAGAGAASDMTFSCSMEKDSATGWNVVSLNAVNVSDPKKSITVKIAPEGGNNMFSFTIGGTEILMPPETLGKLATTFAGNPILYPTPNRIRNGIYVFRGDTLRMGFPGETRSHAGHGLVWDDPAWKYDSPVAGKSSASFTARYVFDSANPRFAAYPYRNMLTMTYTLLGDRVRAAYEVENLDTRPLGFGFALHPFWNIIGKREEVSIRVPLPWHMDATNMLPSGKLDRVTKDSKWSLLELTPLSKLRLDDVYFGATPKSKVDVVWSSIGLELHQRASADFTHVVVYTPDRDFFCIENQTCSTDALNLYSMGLVKESHLQVLAPGKKTGGYVEYIPVWTKK